jgi:hypothetical protein
MKKFFVNIFYFIIMMFILICGIIVSGFSVIFCHNRVDIAEYRAELWRRIIN